MDMLARMKKRFDLLAVDQLREELSRQLRRVEDLEAENNQLQLRAAEAEEWAEAWRDDFTELQQTRYPDSSLGISKSGNLKVVHV